MASTNAACEVTEPLTKRRNYYERDPELKPEVSPK
jgi:hypothetical protein